MNAKDAIKKLLISNHDVLKMYLSDLSDADLLVRPAPNANHVAWQLGHLISSESKMIGGVGGAPPKLPSGFAERHTKETATSDSPSGFLKKAEYVELSDQLHEAALKRLEQLSEADLDKASPPPMASWAPTYGDALMLIATHKMMHAGQFTVLRRKLGKPILM